MNATNPATYGDTRTAAQIAATQIAAARLLPGADLAALDREAARRGVDQEALDHAKAERDDVRWNAAMDALAHGR